MKVDVCILGPCHLPQGSHDNSDLDILQQLHQNLCDGTDLHLDREDILLLGDGNISLHDTQVHYNDEF